jgi:hypothetical protein
MEDEALIDSIVKRGTTLLMNFLPIAIVLSTYRLQENFRCINVETFV